MSESIIVTILPVQPAIKTVLAQPAQIQTKILVGQGPAGQGLENFTGDPLAYYILAKS